MYMCECAPYRAVNGVAATAATDCETRDGRAFSITCIGEAVPVAACELVSVSSAVNGIHKYVLVAVCLHKNNTTQ